jgi:hypothetical protein
MREMSKIKKQKMEKHRRVKIMCRKLIVTNKLSLGARELGWETYSLPKGEVVEFTSKQLKDAIRLGTDEVYGLKISEETGELVFDTENFFTTNMMNKLHINTLIPMEESDCLANLFYIVIGSRQVKQETVYDVVSSRYERTTFTAEKVKTLLEMNIISGGAKLEHGEIVTASLKTKETATPASGKETGADGNSQDR